MLLLRLVFCFFIWIYHLGFLQVPVGRATLGRIINVIGEAIDERGDISKLSACIVLHKTSNWFFVTDTLQ